uniref:Peptidase C51 domain-containing protein n=1 Tax=Plasmodiophora brassicae TaxID=37360 RepID=A8E076_PLABS|nr:hypothetical protein [Plasmodiophora brassicae]CAM98706.1 hypothetical protein [Plasmodiophora brassicae]
MFAVAVLRVAVATVVLQGQRSLSSSAAPFGTILGETWGGVQVYGCDSATANSTWMQNYVNGVFTGIKWQCVELARRYLLLNHGVVFDSIPMAYDIYDLKDVVRVGDQYREPLVAYANGSTTVPERGTLLVWAAGGYYAKTGHVAVVVDVHDGYLDIVEQNVEDTIWPPGRAYSRRLRTSRDERTGSFIVHDTFADVALLGWMMVDGSSKPIVAEL